MTSNRPYLIRALYEWLADNHQTPYLLVNAEYDDVQIPLDYVEDGRIVLNVSMTAVRDLNMDNEAISFNARFSGQPMQVYIPSAAVLGIYSRENGQGMLFPDEEASTGDNGDEPPPPKPSPIKKKKSARPALKVVK